jgi:putative Holliday junction resolvase
VLGLDLGSRRVGVAISDSDGRLATPYEVIDRSGDRATDHARVAALVAETGAGAVVVGMPYSLDGSVGPAGERVLDEVDQLRRALDVEVHIHDERLTTVSAQRQLREAGVSSRRGRAVVDSLAAAVLLQSWLDSRAPREGP